MTGFKNNERFARVGKANVNGKRPLDTPNLRRGRDIKTAANVWNPVLFCFPCVSDFVYQLEAIIFIHVVKAIVTVFLHVRVVDLVHLKLTIMCKGITSHWRGFETSKFYLHFAGSYSL